MTTLTFRFVAASVDAVDPQYDLLADDKPTGIFVQDCRGYGGGYSVQELTGTGDDFCLYHIGDRPSLDLAKKRAVVHFNVRGTNKY